MITCARPLVALLLAAVAAQAGAEAPRTAARSRKAPPAATARGQAPAARAPEASSAPAEPGPGLDLGAATEVALPPPPPNTVRLQGAPPPASAAPEPLRPGITPEDPPEAATGFRWLTGLRFRVGELSLTPTGRGSEVELSNVSSMARLAGMKDGPIAGSSTSVSGARFPAAILGFALPFLDRQLSVETILGLPFKQKMYLGGTLAEKPLAPSALGLSTGVPALGKELGEVTLLPPVVTAVYRFFPGAWVRPYVGAGACLMMVLDAKITNPVLTRVRQPKVEIPPALGWVVQAGTELRLGVDGLRGRFYLALDAKYVGGLEVTARVKDIWVETPELPIYKEAKVGDTTSRTRIDPFIAFIGVGVDL
jgi:outer membrane protein W